MGMEDRDYYWEDRKRRVNKFDKKDTYYRPKEFKRTGGEKLGKPPNDWQNLPSTNKQQWKLLFALFAGGFVTFWAVMITLNLNAELLYAPFETTRKLLVFSGFYN